MPGQFLPSARGGRKIAQAVDLEVVREIAEDDLTALLEPVGIKPPTLVALRHGHHMLAQALAKGTSPGEASLITGYSLSRISILQTDPAFNELLAHYRGIAELRFASIIERMTSLGLSSMEELQERLESKPESFSPRELMELTELMLVKGRVAGGGANGGGSGPSGVNIQVKFVTADTNPVIEGKITNG